jgi:D-beta-D-heptose 7-phosphate kinase/D-beta-D-heptose 1-phosphate adenosyltransferase
LPRNRESLDDDRARDLLAGFARLRVLVVGDAFLDEYLYGDARRVSPEAPVPVVHVESETTVLGGAGNVARNVVALGARCDFCGVVGRDASGERVTDLFAELGVDPSGLVVLEDRPTTHKTRVVARRQQVVRVDRERVDPLGPEAAAQLQARIDAALAGADVVVVEDYAKGLLTREVGRALMRSAGEADVPVFLDPKRSLEPFPGATLVKPNLVEAESISGLRASGDGGIEAVGRELQKLARGADIAITRGGSGISIFEGDAPEVYVPTLRQEVFDVQGAGDTIIATLALARQAGASLWQATVLANAAASVVVRKAGTATADPGEVLAALPAVRAAAQSDGSVREEEGPA